MPAPVEGQRPLGRGASGRTQRPLLRAGRALRQGQTPIYVATIVTDKGNIVAELYQDTPEGLNNFVTLAQNGFYDGLTFHRVEPGFVIQGGDPLGEGNGGPGYTIPAEINHYHPRVRWPGRAPATRSTPSGARAAASSTSRWTRRRSSTAPTRVFGQVIEGMDVADKIAVGDKIQRIDISKGTTRSCPRRPTRRPSPTPTISPRLCADQPGGPPAGHGRGGGAGQVSTTRRPP